MSREPELGRKITIHRAGNLRRWADTSTPATGEVAEDDEKVFRYWTRGESISLTMPDGEKVEENIWYAVGLHAGDRMWSGLSTERPD